MKCKRYSVIIGNVKLPLVTAQFMRAPDEDRIKEVSLLLFFFLLKNKISLYALKFFNFIFKRGGGGGVPACRLPFSCIMYLNG